MELLDGEEIMLSFITTLFTDFECLGSWYFASISLNGSGSISTGSLLFLFAKNSGINLFTTLLTYCLFWVIGPSLSSLEIGYFGVKQDDLDIGQLNWLMFFQTSKSTMSMSSSADGRASRSTVRHFSSRCSMMGSRVSPLKSLPMSWSCLSSLPFLMFFLISAGFWPSNGSRLEHR